MTAKEVVREVICLFKGGEKWNKGAYCKDASGRGLPDDGPQNEKAATFCLLGAAHRVLGLDTYVKACNHDVLREFATLIRDSLPKRKLEEARTHVWNGTRPEADPGDFVVAFNDDAATTFDDVEAILAKALVSKSRKYKTTQPAR